MRDVWTVLRKELKELSVVDGGLITSLSFLAFVGLIGVVLPWQIGPMWVRATWPVVFWAWMPLFLVTTVTADSFAGERERHTLETLLATRLPDWAILTGKVGAAVVWVWLATMICVPVGLVTLNIAYADQGPLLYTPTAALGVMVVAFLAALLGASLGVLVSLRASTVRQAQQALTLCVMVILLGPALSVRFMPTEWTDSLVKLFILGDPAAVAFALSATFLGVDVLLLLAAIARFQRTKLLFR
jgi:ABC-2 type transport system permease protein